MKSAEPGLAMALASAMVLAGTVAFAGPATNNAEAHAIAERFAAAEAEAKKAEAAKREAEAKRKAFEQAQRIERQRAYRAAVARRAAERKTEGERRRAAQMKADEAEMLARARAEAEAARQAAEKAADDRKSAATAPKPDASPAAQVASGQPRKMPTEAKPTVPIPVAPVAAHEPGGESREALEARRQAESDALAEKLSRFRKTLSVAREHAHQHDDKTAAEPELNGGQPPSTSTAENVARSTAPKAEAAVSPPRASEPRHNESGIDGTPSSRATVLLVIEHGRRGIRRFDKTGDPILCLDETCFVSAGSDRPALRMSRARAFGPGNTFGGRAGACSHSLTCVLRNVDLGGDAVVIQPIDLRVMYHDRRERAEVRGDSDCSLNAGRLSCRFSVKGSDWRAWIVPERLAAKAGPEALEAALDAGL